jgi:iron-sulfur cluster repair protein YtfE (RIC family)
MLARALQSSGRDQKNDPGESMNALELLKEDHDRVDRLFQKVQATDEGEHIELFEKINSELEVHTHIEETIFYPQIKDGGDEELQKLVAEGIEEHRQAKMFLRELSQMKTDGERFEAKLKVLMEDIKHHVQEEEGEMFHMIEKQFDESSLEEIGAQLQEEKSKFNRSRGARAGK